MKFTKMQGAGNDYVYVDCTQNELKNVSEVAVAVSDRHFGIGSDGLILIKKSDKADFFMEMYNADGSQGSMCGNGIRCVGKYVYDNGLTDKAEITVETLSGIKTLQLYPGSDGKVKTVRVNMGAPILQPEQIPADIHAFKNAETLKNVEQGLLHSQQRRRKRLRSDLCIHGKPACNCLFRQKCGFKSI